MLTPVHLVVLIPSGDGGDQTWLIPPGVMIPPVLMVQIPPGGSDQVISACPSWPVHQSRWSRSRGASERWMQSNWEQRRCRVIGSRGDAEQLSGEGARHAGDQASE